MLAPLRLSDIRRMAGLRTFRRGEAYEQGRVGRVTRRGGHIQAEVIEGHGERHRVEIRAAEGDLRLHCNCPSAADETCEHIVAVLLGWLEEEFETGRPEDSVGLEDVDLALRKLRKPDLVDLLLKFALRDDGIMNALELHAANTVRKPVDTGRYKQMIRNALSHKFVDYYHTGDFLRNLEGLRVDLDRLREAGRGREAHACFAYLLEKALDRYREVEDTDSRFSISSTPPTRVSSSGSTAGWRPQPP